MERILNAPELSTCRNKGFHGLLEFFLKRESQKEVGSIGLEAFLFVLCWILIVLGRIPNVLQRFCKSTETQCISQRSLFTSSLRKGRVVKRTKERRNPGKKMTTDVPTRMDA